MSLPDCDIVLAGRYRMAGRIASGGMGEVWRAADTVLERPVAVKLLRAEYSRDPDTLARFRAEARHAAAVSHPGIAHVYDYGEGGPDGSPFLVMELVDGPSLTELLARRPLDAVQTLDVVAQAAAALAAAHSAGLVHRDIKPGNLLLTSGGIVKITDFGIAYAAGSAPLTRTGALIGTPAYLAPERVAGAPATPASDLYSLGIVAYECLAGTPPFGGTPMQIALAHQRRDVPPLRGGVPADVAAFVAQLTARDPAARPRGAAAVAARARYLQGTLAGGQTRPGGWPAPAARPLAGAALAARAAQASQATAVPAELSGAGRPTLADARPAMPETFQLQHPAGTRRPAVLRHPLLLAAVFVAVIAGLAGWTLASGVVTAVLSQRPAASSPAPTSSSVDVNSSQLIGLPVQAAERQLSQLGLSVTVTCVPTRQAVPGTVLAVRPTGQVQPGTPVTLEAASPSGHHHHDRGQDGSDGGSPGTCTSGGTASGGTGDGGGFSGGGN